MTDLAIHRRLADGTATTADLDEIAGWPLARRVAYLGAIEPLALHGEPGMRATALRALAGARGHEGVRTIVARLDDSEEGVRSAALEALRVVAREVPERYAHALFHPRPEVRRASLQGELSLALGKLAIYLRADPACADLAAKLRWPDDALPVALELYEAGHVPATEVLEALTRTSVSELRELLARELARPPETVDAYLEGTSRDVPPGADILDVIVRAIAAAGATERALDAFIETVGPTKNRVLARRAAVALLGYLRRVDEPAAAMVGACVALEPRVIGFPGFETHAAAATRGLFRFRWPVKPTVPQVMKLVALPHVRADLALAAAVVGLLPGKRLAALRDALGQDAIVTALVASNHGWDEVCKLPGETPALELGWLNLVEKVDYKRYLTLAGGALGILAGKRLEAFVDQLPRRHRQPAFASALDSHAAASDEKLAAVCKAIAARADRETLIALLQPLAEAEDPRVVLAFVRAIAPRMLFEVVQHLGPTGAVHLVGWVAAEPLGREHEVALAAAFAKRKEPAIVAWCAQVNATVTTPPSSAPQVAPKRALTAMERERIARCSDRDLAEALKPALAGAVTGLCSALAGREPRPNITACVALLGCADPLEDVARALDRFAEHTIRFDGELDDAVCAWRFSKELPPLALARLWRWEQPSFAFLDWLEAHGGPLGVLQLADSLPGVLARETLWKAASESLMLVRFRFLERFRTSLASDALATYCADRVDQLIGVHAARILVALVESRATAIESVRDAVLDRVADADAPTREYIARIVRLVGVAEAPPVAPPPPSVMLENVRTSTDLDRLAAWCADPRPQVVQEAALVLVILGPAGQLRLAELLASGVELPAPIPVLASILLWDHEPALAIVRELARTPALAPAWQFHLHLSLVARGEADALARALDAVRAAPGRWYFRREDWDALVRVADIVTCSIALADAPHHHAYQRAIQILLSLTHPSPDAFDALVRFLHVSDDRPLHLRVAVARRLCELGSTAGLPLLVEYMADERADDWLYTLELIPPDAWPAATRMIVDAALIGGPSVCSEKRMWALVQRVRERGHLPADVAAELDMRILENASTAAARRAAAKFAVAVATGDDRLRRVAEVFAWGVRRGVELGGKLFAFHLTAKEADLGHTKLDGTRIFVTALPMLRGETHGRDVVEGLVLHELGHHVYHASREAQELWKQAHAEGIGHFLNLIADEHLERNLRAIDPAYGDRLKRLGAYAFQHAPQEIKLAMLLDCLRGASAPALIAADLQVAFDEQSVRMRRGAILTELDRVGHPVARFARALRMGLGNRSGDPLTARALALCGKDLRSLDMAGLYALTKQLVALFGGATRLANLFGGPEGLQFGERDDDVFGAGIDDEILQREVERILDPRRSKGNGKGRGPERLAINVNPDTHFDKINTIKRVRGDQEAHRGLALQVHRHSTRLRQFLDELGLRWEPMRARTQGRALDRTRLRALVTRNDPRILIARNPVRRTDLFLGVLIDCSGSMQAGNNLDRARRFAILVAEAVRALPGVEARFFGFTDSTIYDAGTATDCNVVALQSEGGNNDAAALYHAANVALSSNKRAKILIMISDGLPTECSVAALRGLVVHLTKRRNIVCAQVAVRKLDEVCFPNYVVLDDRELDIAVAKFGRMIGDLARRSLAS